MGVKLPDRFIDILPWNLYEKWPRVNNVDIFPFSNPFKFAKYYSAWHLGSVGVFPHTKQYRLLRSILENDIVELE